MTISPGALATAEDILAALNSNASVSNAAKTAADAATAAVAAATSAASAAQATANAALLGSVAINVRTAPYNAKGDGTTDDSGAIQAALNACATAGGGIVYCPPTGKSYVLATGLQVPGGVQLKGAATKTLQGGSTNVSAWSAVGTWFQCTDTVNAAVSLGTVALVAHGAMLSGINFIYSQPVPGPSSWTPTVYPWAINVMSDHVIVEDVMVVGATHGINLEAPNEFGIGAGIRLRNVYLSVYQRGLRTFKINDTITIDNLFVEDQTYTAGFTYPAAVSYLLNNLVGWEIDYCDNPLVTNMYLFLCRYGMLCTDESILSNTHSLFNASMVNLQTVLCRTGISVATSTTTATGCFVNWNAQSSAGATDTLFNLPSDNVDFSITNLTVPWAGARVMELGGGTGGKVNISGLDIAAYSAVAAGQVGLQVNAGATLALGSRTITKVGGAGTKIAGAGVDEIDSPYNQCWQPHSAANQFSITGSDVFVPFSSVNWFNPISAGIIQARMIGTINVATAVAGGIAVLRLEAFPEITTTSLSVAATGHVMFDTNWIDLSSVSHSIGRVMIDASTPAVIQNFDLTVLFR